MQVTCAWSSAPLSERERERRVFIWHPESNSDLYSKCIKDIDSNLIAEYTNNSHNYDLTILIMQNMKTEAVNSNISWSRRQCGPWWGSGAAAERPEGGGRKDSQRLCPQPANSESNSAGADVSFQNTWNDHVSSESFPSQGLQQTSGLLKMEMKIVITGDVVL